MKFVFDLDNTLYSFEETGIDNFMRANIVQYIVEHMGLVIEEAQELSEKYYAQYGLCIAGLAQHHGVDAKHYCAFVHSFDMSVVRPDEKLAQLLADIERQGHELWIFTNADVPHAERMLEGLEIRSFFTDSATGALRVIDCFAQWDHSSPSFHNKPEPTAYECASKVMNVQPGEAVVMFDDSEMNLRAPAAMGWKTVWVSHGRELPRSATAKHFVLRNLHELPGIMTELTASQ